MCHYVTAYVPAGADLTAVEAILDSYNFGFSIVENRHVAQQLGSRTVQILTTRGMCDCGTSLASARTGGRLEAPNDSHLQKLRKKGWGESRIQRWLDEKAGATQRQE